MLKNIIDLINNDSFVEIIVVGKDNDIHYSFDMDREKSESRRINFDEFIADELRSVFFSFAKDTPYFTLGSDAIVGGLMDGLKLHSMTDNNHIFNLENVIEFFSDSNNQVVSNILNVLEHNNCKAETFSINFYSDRFGGVKSPTIYITAI